MNKKSLFHGRTRLFINPLAVECPWCFAEPENRCMDEDGKWLEIKMTEDCETLSVRIHGVREDKAREQAKNE